MLDDFSDREPMLVSQEAEQGLLGALLTDTAGRAWRKVVGRITDADFGFAVHGAIFREIARLHDTGTPVNVLALKPVADDIGAMIGGDGWGYLVELAGGFGVGSVVTYVEEITELARRRRLHEAALVAASAALNRAQPLSEATSDLIITAEGLVEGGNGRSRREVLEALVQQVDKPAAIDPTGLPSMDAAMAGGLHRGRVYAIAGLSKRGKTMFATTISHHLNAAGTRHAYVALEMGGLEIETRQAARDLRVSSMCFMGNVRADLRQRLADYALTAPANTHYCDLPGGTIDELRGEVLSAVHRHGCRGVIVDYWQLISGRDRGVSEEEHLRLVAQWLAKAAKKLKIWVLVLAQLADDGEATAVSRTGLNRAADQVFFIRGDADSDERWMEMRASRYTPVGDIGSKSCPAFKIILPGPHVMDLGSRE